jgi:hypothetical protein
VLGAISEIESCTTEGRMVEQDLPALRTHVQAVIDRTPLHKA